MPERNDEPPQAGTATAAGLHIHPVTADRWDGMVALFETSPVMSSCWCMSPRLRARDFGRFGAEARNRNRDMMHELVRAGTIPGLLAYAGERPVAWISIGPRDEFTRLRHPSHLPAPEHLPVWSIVCLYTRREYRRQGITRSLIQAAMRHAAEHGAATVEAYPIGGWGQDTGPGDAHTGLASTFRGLSFSEVGVSGSSRGQPRYVMRYITPGSDARPEASGY